MSTTTSHQFEQALQAHQVGKLNQAKTLYLQILEDTPENTACLNNLGCILAAEHDFDEARKLFQSAIEKTPDFADPYNNLGNLYKAENNLNIAKQYYQQALNINAEFAEAHCNLATVLQNTGLVDEAIGHIKKALEINPNYIEAYNNLGFCFMIKEDYKLAIHSLHEALTLAPYYDPAFYNLGLCYALQDKHLAAIGCFEQVSDQDQGLLCLSLHEKVFSQLKLCEWDELNTEISTVEQLTNAQWATNPHFDLDPFIISALPLSIEFQNKVNQKRAQKIAQSITYPPFTPHKYPHSKIRIGFISPDFNRHPMSILLGEQWRHFDRHQFSIFSYYTGAQIDLYTQTISKSSDIFKHLKDLTDYEIAQIIHDDGIDILIDLSGYTKNNALSVLAYRPARIQCHGLGYMGSLQAPFIDYYLADETLLPTALRSHFSEKIAYFPGSFACAYPFELPDELPSRGEFGLTTDQFVYCAFVSNYRIHHNILKHWCDILKATPDSILWLMIPNYLAQCNLLKYVKQQGVDPHRILFCRDIDISSHWGIRFADVFLDTQIISSGTSTFLSLWMDVPVITLNGETPQSKTCSSILNGHGYTHGICQTIDEYKQKAISFYQHPAELKAHKSELATLKLSAPTFNPDIYIDHFERLLIKMVNQPKPCDIKLEEQTK